MKFDKLTASMAALMLSSTALMAQESPSMQSVFIDVGGTAVLVPMDVALEACGLDESTLQSTVQARIDESGIDQTQLTAQMDSAMGMMSGGDAATQDTAAADPAATGTEATTDTTQSADATATTDTGAASTDTTATTDTATADASGAAADDASGAATGTETTDTATADASGAAGQDATATGEVENVEATAADSGAAAGSASADPFIALAACQIDATRATELQIDTTMTGSSMGFDATTLGLQTQ